MPSRHAIPVIDIFAGPGGLGEGFARLEVGGRKAFRSVLAIEKDAAAHRTLTLRAFFRKFGSDKLPPGYIDYIRGTITREQLFAKSQKKADAAIEETWQAELGSPDYPIERVRERVSQALGRTKDWVLLGGPPCQAYSLAGRSRNRGIKGYRFEEDHKTTLYLEYLQLIADFWPAVFVMENVKGHRLLTIDAGSIVDAAHIHPFADSRNNDPRNGLALTKNMHWAFDEGLWTVDEAYRIVVATNRFAEVCPDGKPLAAYANAPLRLPRESAYEPDAAHFAWHRRHRFVG